MKNTPILKWLTSLTSEKLVRALLMIGICAMFTMLVSTTNELKRTRNTLILEQEYRRQEILRRTDSFNVIMTAMRDLYSRKYETYLEEQIEKIDKTNKIVNNTLSTNSKLIKKIHAK